MVGGVFEMRHVPPANINWDYYYQELLESQGFEDITDLLAKYHNLERVNKEWETLWKPIDDFVRPCTPLGQCVSKRTLQLVKIGVQYE